MPRWRAGGWQAAWEVLALGVVAAAGAEFVRLFVVTHSCDATDLATNGLAVLCGWCVGISGRRPAVSVLAAAGWIVALAYLNWFPFDFHFDSTSWARLRDVSWLPFADYLQSAYLETAQGAADKVIQFVVLGALLAPSRRLAGVRAWAAVAAAGVLAVLFEAGQLCLPTRFASVTDVLVETASAGLGLLAWGRLQAGPCRPDCGRLRRDARLRSAGGVSRDRISHAARACLPVLLECKQCGRDAIRFRPRCYTVPLNPAPTRPSMSFIVVASAGATAPATAIAVLGPGLRVGQPGDRGCP